jgi:hypothetical protein
MSGEELDFPSKELIKAELDKYTTETGFRVSDEITEDAISELGDSARERLANIFDFGEEYQAIYANNDDPEIESSDLHMDWLELREKGKILLSDAVAYHGLLKFGYVQDLAIYFGAVPDPKDGFKYYVNRHCDYDCWTCDESVQVKTQFLTVRWDSMPLAGTGEVRTRQKAYCPNCEDEPSDSGIIMASEVERHEAAILKEMRELKTKGI